MRSKVRSTSTTDASRRLVETPACASGPTRSLMPLLPAPIPPKFGIAPSGNVAARFASSALGVSDHMRARYGQVKRGADDRQGAASSLRGVEIQMIGQISPRSSLALNWTQKSKSSGCSCMRRGGSMKGLNHFAASVSTVAHYVHKQAGDCNDAIQPSS